MRLLSAGQEGFVTESSHPTGQDLQDESESFVSSASSGGQQTSERRVHAETSGHLPWRERQLSGAGSPPEPSDSGMRRLKPQEELKWWIKKLECL